MNLLLFANFKLPEWLTFSTAITSLITILGLITAIIKLRNSKASTEGYLRKFSDRLTSSLELMSRLDETGKQIHTVIVTVSTAVDKVITAVETITTSVNNVAAFVFECFNTSNLSAENKLKLKVLFDRLFYKTDAAIIDELKAAKADADAVLLEKDTEITKLNEKIGTLVMQLNNAQTAVRKTRRISN